MSNPNDPDGGVPPWLTPIEYTEGLEDDDEPPGDDVGGRSSIAGSQPGARHPRSGKPTSNYSTYVDLRHNPARFDLERLGQSSDGNLWFGREDRDGELLCRVRGSAGDARWVLIYLGLSKEEANVFSIAELESMALSRNYDGEPVNREVTPQEAAEWLERNGYQLPDDLEPAPPFEPVVPQEGRLSRTWQPPHAPDREPPKPAKTWKSRVVLRGPGEPPLVDGKEKDRLSAAQYAVLKALLDAGEAGLSRDRLIVKSGRGGAIQVLKRLSQRDSDWRSAIVLPGERGRGYRLASV